MVAGRVFLVVLGYTRLRVPQEKMGSGSTNKPSKPAAQEGKEGSQTKQDPGDPRARGKTK
jgi:hypothetical protein